MFQGNPPHPTSQAHTLNDVEDSFLAEISVMREDMADLFRRLEYKAPPGVRQPHIIDGRWASIAKTQLQQGMMALERSIVRPKEF